MKLNLAVTLLISSIIFEQHSLVASGKLNTTSIARSLNNLDDCFKDTVISFVDSKNYIPLNINQLDNMCKKNNRGLQCIKDKSQSYDPLIKRFLKSYMQARQKFLKKYCTNINSDISRSFIQAMNCAWDNNKKDYIKTDTEYFTWMQAIEKKRFDDSKLELKYICCSILNYVHDYEAHTKPKCSSHQRVWKEVVDSFTSHELGLLCPEDDKFLETTCLPLQRLDTFSKPDLDKLPVSLTIYLVMTLGEP